jgi:hypothetical protein
LRVSKDIDQASRDRVKMIIDESAQAVSPWPAR